MSSRMSSRMSSQMSHSEANSAALLARYPELESKLGVKPEEALSIVQTKSGAATGRYKKRYVHSRFDPAAEAAKLIERECGGSISVALFFGFGLGYQVEAFMALHPNTDVAVFEPDSAFFIKALSSRNLTGLLTSSQFHLFLEMEPEAIVPHLDALPFAHPKVIRLRSVYEKDQTYYARLDRIIQSYVSRKNINLPRAALQYLAVYLVDPGQ